MEPNFSPLLEDSIKGGRRAGSPRRRTRELTRSIKEVTEHRPLPRIENAKIPFELEQEALRNSGAITLWPYCLRLPHHMDPLLQAKAERKNQLAQELAEFEEARQAELSSDEIPETTLESRLSSVQHKIQAALRSGAGSNTADETHGGGIQFVEPENPDAVALKVNTKELEAVEGRIKEAQQQLLVIERSAVASGADVAKLIEATREILEANVLREKWQLRRPRPDGAPPLRNPHTLPIPFLATKESVDATVAQRRTRAEVADRAAAQAAVEAEEAKLAKISRIRASTLKKKAAKEAAEAALKVEEEAKAKAAREADSDYESEDESEYSEEGTSSTLNTEELRLKYRNEAAVRSRARRLQVECPGCGMIIRMMDTMKHNKTECSNRKVPCRNFELGCGKMIRMNVRHLHEDCSNLLAPRTCLYFGGMQSYIALNEDQVEAPWTAEFWMWRASLGEETKTKISKTIELRHNLLVAQRAVVEFRSKVDLLEAEVAEAGKEAAMTRTAEADAAREKITDTLIIAAAEVQKSQLAEAVIKARYREHVKLVVRSIQAMRKTGESFDSFLGLLETPRVVPEPEKDRSHSGTVEAAERPWHRGTRAANEHDIVVSIEKPRNSPSPRSDAEDMAPRNVETKEEISNTQEHSGNFTETDADVSRDDIELVDGFMKIKFRSIDEVLNKMNELLNEVATEEAKEATTDNDEGDGAHKIKEVKAATSKKEKRKQKLKAKRMKRQMNKTGIKFSDQLAAAIRGNLGRDTIASSENGRLQLSVGDADCFGLSIPGHGEFSSKTVIPRGRWVHLALVAAAPPKKRISIYVDGESAGHIDHVKFPLPMREIGDKEMSFQGHLQEVRYWSTPRSKKELRSAMHSVLPEEATEEGLIGYWTLEEGGGSYVNDLSETRFRAKVSGETKWILSKDVAAGVEPPTPPARERGICQVEIKRSRLAKKGRESLNLIPCPAGCPADVMKKNVRFHMLYECPRRSMLCPLCSQEVPSDELTAHMQRFCPTVMEREKILSQKEKDMIPLECPVCDEPIPRRDLKEHINSLCEHRLVDCMRNCGVKKMKAKYSQTHLRYFCRKHPALSKRRKVEAIRVRHPYARPWQRNMKQIFLQPGKDFIRAEDSDEGSDSQESDGNYEK